MTKRVGKKDRVLTNHLNYMNRRFQEDTIIILDDLEFTWEIDDIKKVKSLWDSGQSIENITAAVKREGDEVFLLLLHLARHEKISQRVGYIWGNK